MEEFHEEVADIVKEDLWTNPFTYFNHDADEAEFLYALICELPVVVGSSGIGIDPLTIYMARDEINQSQWSSILLNYQRTSHCVYLAYCEYLKVLHV
ncbi:hypothetical protein Tco_0706945, partial [Tanacetum coccineum]